MHKAKHVMPVEHRNTYEQWRALLEAEHILKIDGSVDLEKLEKRYPDTLSKAQIVWIEAMQKGEILEEGDDVDLDEPTKDQVPVPEPEPDEETEEVVEEPADDEEAAPPPPPGESEKKYEVGQTLMIQVEEDGDAEEVTITKISKDGIHLQSSKDEDTEYLVDQDELHEMIVEA